MNNVALETEVPANMCRDGRQQDWMAGHLHFSGNPNPMLYELVGPFLKAARRDGLIDGFFFIRYWTEGQHIRVRMRPTEGVDRRELQADFERATHEFLARRPFLLPAMQLESPEALKTTFLAEYPESKWNDLYGANGTMPLHEPNQLLWTQYEPEFGRYGGIHGMTLSERHFESSSNLIFTLLETSNLHIRSITLGAAAQVMTSMMLALLGSVPATLAFLENYERRWRTGWGGLYAPRAASFEEAFRTQADTIVPRVESIAHATQSALNDPTRPDRSYLESWARECRSVRREIEELASAGLLTFPRQRDSELWDFQPDPEIATRGLAFSYVHMMNNRLGVPIVDEIYLSYLLRRAIEESSLDTGNERIVEP